MNDTQKAAIKQFFVEKFNEFQHTGGDFGLYLAELVIKPKAEQKAILVAWLDAKKTKNTAAIAALPAQQLASEEILNTENATIDALKTAL